MTQELNKELEELLDAELTEEEVAAVDSEITDLEEAEEVGDPSKAADKVKTETLKKIYNMLLDEEVKSTVKEDKDA